MTELCPHCGEELPDMVKKLRCKRCDHNWVPRDTGAPHVCPKCKSPYWDRERIRRPGWKKKRDPIPKPDLGKMMEETEEAQKTRPKYKGM
jgi:predicted RNA-binding Zn-ribbon protein involved in translation (DUF1610 family)